MSKETKQQENENPTFQHKKGSMEWRLFIPATKYKSLDINKLLKIKQSPFSFGFPDTRTDCYVVMADDSFGLKFRFGKNLEIKERVEYDKKSKIESWIKSKLNYNTKNISIKNLMSKINEDITLQTNSMKICLKLMNEFPCYIIQINKNRTNCYYKKLNIEQAKCKLKLIDKNIPKKIDKILNEKNMNSEWISICIEGTSNSKKMIQVSQDLLNVLSKKVDMKDVIIGGYPHWLCVITNLL